MLGHLTFHQLIPSFRSPQTFSSQPAVGGVGEVTRSRSPQSDGGYGTSFDSNESRGQVMRRDIDIDGLSELLVQMIWIPILLVAF